MIAIILSAAVLAYGFIDAGSYRAGYKAASVTAYRNVRVACMNGFVLDSRLCDVAQAAMGSADTAQVSRADQTASVITASRRMRRRQAQPDIPTAASVAEETVPVQAVTPSMSPAETEIRDRITKAKALSPTHCSEKNPRECGIGFNCAVSPATGLCDFKDTVKGLRAIADDQISQSMPCLSRDAIDRLGGVGTFVQGLQSAVCANVATGKFFFTSMPTDIRPLAELNYVDTALKAFVNAYGVTAAAITQSAVPALESCMARGQRLYVPGQPMPSMRPGIDCAMDSGMMQGMPSCPSNRWSNGICVSSAYAPSTLAQLIGAIIDLFR